MSPAQIAVLLARSATPAEVEADRALIAAARDQVAASNPRSRRAARITAEAQAEHDRLAGVELRRMVAGLRRGDDLSTCAEDPAITSARRAARAPAKTSAKSTPRSVPVPGPVVDRRASWSQEQEVVNRRGRERALRMAWEARGLTWDPTRYRELCAVHGVVPHVLGDEIR